MLLVKFETQFAANAGKIPKKTTEIPNFKLEAGSQM